MPKKVRGGGRRGMGEGVLVRVDVYKELKLLYIKKSRGRGGGCVQRKN